MFEEILFPTDGSDGAAVVFEHALDLATTHDATVHILNVADTTQDSVVRVQGNVIDVLEREGEEFVEEASERARERGVDTVTEVVQGKPYSTIVDYADARGVDLVVMPTHGRSGLERFLLGSTTERVVRRATVPVLTVRPDGDTPIEYPYQTVLVPTDGSKCAKQALSVGVDVANAEGAALHVLSVVVTASLGLDVRSNVQVDALEERAGELVDDATAFAREAGVESVSGTTEFGASVPRAITSYIEEQDVDFVVTGTHGRTGFDRFLLGSVTENLIRTAPVPVLTVRELAEETS